MPVANLYYVMMLVSIIRYLASTVRGVSCHRLLESSVLFVEICCERLPGLTQRVGAVLGKTSL